MEGAPKFKGFSCNEYSNRVSALSKGTKSLMESIGAWDIIKSVRHKPVKQMQVILFQIQFWLMNLIKKIIN